MARRSPPPNSLGKGAKSNFISLHRAEYLALIARGEKPDEAINIFRETGKGQRGGVESLRVHSPQLAAFFGNPIPRSLLRGRLFRTMFLVNKHQLMEKGVITQAELDHYLDFPLHKRLDQAAQLTGYKICLAENPETKLDEIE